MEFKDRISSYPGRYTMTDENGNVSNVVLERNDEPVQEGTPLNADTFNSMQEAIQIESEEYPGCFYKMVDGEKQWLNPPMIPWKLYATTERYNGDTVYVTACEVPLGDDEDEGIADGGKFSVNSSFPTGGYITDVCGVAEWKNGNNTVCDPINVAYKRGNYCNVSFAGKSVTVEYSSGYKGYTLRLLVKFAFNGKIVGI